MKKVFSLMLANFRKSEAQHHFQSETNWRKTQCSRSHHFTPSHLEFFFFPPPPPRPPLNSSHFPLYFTSIVDLIFYIVLSKRVVLYQLFPLSQKTLRNKIALSLWSCAMRESCRPPCIEDRTHKCTKMQCEICLFTWSLIT